MLHEQGQQSLLGAALPHEVRDVAGEFVETGARCPDGENRLHEVHCQKVGLSVTASAKTPRRLSCAVPRCPRGWARPA